LPASYLGYFPKPILEDLVQGRWLPVVGAGMSLNARAPVGKKLPLWSDLAKLLEIDLDDFASNSPIDAISAYEHQYGRTRLVERLFELLLIREAQPGDAHREFCALPFDIVCTTNFDFLLERQYELTPRYVYPVVNEDQLSLNASTAGTLLLKLHGDMHHPERMIATEADYDGFLTKYPLLATFLSNQLITKTAVLIGYSLEDPDFRQIWHVITQRLGRTRRPAYAVMVSAKPSEVTRFERRGVHVINLPGSKSQYGEILAATFRELRDFMLPGVLAASSIKEERPLRELRLPADSASRLCFFALPLELLSLYRDKVFPAVEAAGFVPVTADDIVSPGDNISAKIDALIDRATVVVVEPTTPWTMAELRIALARRKERDKQFSHRSLFQLIIVINSTQPIPSDAIGESVLRRDDQWLNHPEEFASELVQHLQIIAPQSEFSRGEEARRLLIAKEYNAAVIAAMTHLETSLRERLDKQPWDEVGRPMSMRSLLMTAISRQIVRADDRRLIEKWIGTRNSVVHTAVHVNRQQAKEIVDGVMRILDGK
jgi:hypothetical protein